MQGDAPQFGAATVIGHEVQAILLDCFETLVELSQDGYRPRRGVEDFLRHYGGKPGIRLVVISDGDARSVAMALHQAGLAASRFAAVYHAGNAVEVLESGRLRKRLDIPLRDLGLKPDQVVFIGDSPLDAEAARHHGVPFIRIPRSEDRDFSLAVLVNGPSRYRSAEFEVRFLDTHGKGGGKAGPA